MNIFGTLQVAKKEGMTVNDRTGEGAGVVHRHLHEGEMKADYHHAATTGFGSESDGSTMPTPVTAHMRGHDVVKADSGVVFKNDQKPVLPSGPAVARPNLEKQHNLPQSKPVVKAPPMRPGLTATVSNGMPGQGADFRVR